jgi:hypothetical protein
MVHLQLLMEGRARAVQVVAVADELLEFDGPAFAVQLDFVDRLPEKWGKCTTCSASSMFFLPFLLLAMAMEGGMPG